MRLLIVKTSSFGDIVHCFPALSIAHKLLPDLRCDWLARPLYSSLLELHPAVNTARRLPGWTKPILGAEGKAKYDLLVDAQGLLRSAAVARRYPAENRAGYSWCSAREPLASLIYGQRYQVSFHQHAVQRNIDLLLQALSLPIAAATPHLGDYGLPRSQPKSGRIALVANASGAHKCWNSAGWQELIKIIAGAGRELFLPWGSHQERDSCARLAQVAPAMCHIPAERLDFKELAQELSNCSGLIGLDTGVSHFGAALGLPVVALYLATAPELCGVWSPRALNLALEPRQLRSRAQRRAWRHLDSSNNYHGNLRIRSTKLIQARELWQLLLELGA